MSEEARGIALVVAAVSTLQVGAAFAVTLFDEVGPAGAALLRLGIAAVVLLAIWRPRPHGRDLRLAAAFGIALGPMNWAIYAAMDRIPIGVAVTIEFAGPLGLAVVALAPAARPRVGRARRGRDPAADRPVRRLDLDAAGVAFALPPAACGRPTSRSPRAPARCSRAAPGSRSRWSSARSSRRPSGSRATCSQPALLAAGAVVALASSVIPYSLELESLRRIPARVFGVLMSLEPAVAALAGFVVLGQALGAVDWLAIALVVAASAGVTAESSTAAG